MLLISFLPLPLKCSLIYSAFHSHYSYLLLTRSQTTSILLNPQALSLDLTRLIDRIWRSWQHLFLTFFSFEFEVAIFSYLNSLCWDFSSCLWPPNIEVSQGLVLEHVLFFTCTNSFSDVVPSRSLNFILMTPWMLVSLPWTQTHISHHLLDMSATWTSNMHLKLFSFKSLLFLLPHHYKWQYHFSTCSAH